MFTLMEFSSFFKVGSRNGREVVEEVAGDVAGGMEEVAGGGNEATGGGEEVTGGGEKGAGRGKEIAGGMEDVLERTGGGEELTGGVEEIGFHTLNLLIFDF
jgi:hypothetical protein